MQYVKHNVMRVAVVCGPAVASKNVASQVVEAISTGWAGATRHAGLSHQVGVVLPHFILLGLLQDNVMR
jgi:hypothetical protein